MKNYIINNVETINIKPCECGEYPEFIIPNYHYTDCWLKCNKCGKQTYNAGGYHYASEIPLLSAKRTAVDWWNSNKNIKL